jgi:AcrR family transcriptional regulator
VSATQQPESAPVSGATASGKVRKPDAERTRREILAAARQEFAENGLSGARVDAIAARMKTNKRMIYYYFGSKEGLYLAALEEVYADIRRMEQELDLESLTPADAVRRMIEFTFDYQEAHPDFIRMVSIENIHNGRHLAKSERLRNLNTSVIQQLDAILQRGRDQGAFRSDIGPVDLHMLISAFCFFRVSNRHTFGALFGWDLSAPELRKRHKRMIGDAILGLLEEDGPACNHAFHAASGAGTTRMRTRVTPKLARV